MAKPGKKKKSGMVIAIYMLLITWILLLALLIFIYTLRLQGYNDFNEWKNRGNVPQQERPVIITPAGNVAAAPEQTPTGTPTPTPEQGTSVTVTPEPTHAPTPVGTQVPTLPPTLTPKATLTPTPTPTPTLTPTPTPRPEYLLQVEQGEKSLVAVSELEKVKFFGEETIDSDIRRQAAKFAKGEEQIKTVIYLTGNYGSVILEKADGHLLPLVYDLTGKVQMTGREFIKESYFSIIKERLQTVVGNRFPELAGDKFLTYEEPYDAADYTQFYLTEDKLVFYFDEGTLTDTPHAPFTYETKLKEAKAFFYYTLDGAKNGLAIRELDPNKPMVAITYDDGPEPLVEEKIMELFEQYGGKATFFFVGDRIEGSYKTWIKKLYDHEFEVASHSYSHPKLQELEAKEFWHEVNTTSLVIADATGYAPDYFRVPGGKRFDYAFHIPMPRVNWNVDSLDYKEFGKEDAAEIVFERIKPFITDGKIVLLHSIYEHSYEASALLIPWLVEQGYQLVTITELYYYKGVTMENGKLYSGYDF